MQYIIVIIIILTIIYGPNLWAKFILNKYSRKEYFSGNGFDLARLALDNLGLNHIAVETTDLGDHYDPQNKVVRLSRAHCGKNTLTAVAVAAHEIGHVIQDNTNYKPLQTRTRMIGTAVKIEKVGAAIIFFIPVIAAITKLPFVAFFMLLGGFTTLCIPLVIHFLTLPTELDASFNRALPLLIDGNYIPHDDIHAVKKILRACAFTYIASALVGLLNVWRWIRILRR